MQLNESLKDEPVLIILVNSGNSRREVKKYMNRVEVDLPTIVDRDRSFERQFDVGKITLKNVIQIKVFRPNQGTSRIPSSQMKKHLNRVKGDPSWSVNPSSVPDRLKSLWRAVEFGNYIRAGKLFRNAANGRDQKILKRLRQQVYQSVNQQLNRARKRGENGQYWAAYQHYKNIIMHCRTFPEFEPPRSEMQSLKEKKEVKKQLQASKILKELQTKGGLGRGSLRNSEMKQAYELLKQKFSGTDAAKLAQYLKE